MKHIAIILMCLFAMPALAEIAANCAEQKATIESAIIEKSYCKVDADCIQKMVCPFGCHIIVNKQEDEKINILIEAYYKQCGKCEYKCDSRNNGIVCRENKCVKVE